MLIRKYDCCDLFQARYKIMNVTKRITDLGTTFTEQTAQKLVREHLEPQRIVLKGCTLTGVSFGDSSEAAGVAMNNPLVFPALKESMSEHDELYRALSE